MLMAVLAWGCTGPLSKKVLIPHEIQSTDKTQNIQTDSAPFSKQHIGCLLPLSGKYALFGQKALQGIQLAIQDIAETRNVSLHIVIRDTQGDPQVAAACVDELAKASVMGIIGPLVAGKEAGKRAQTLGIPMISLTQKKEFSAGGDYLFSNFITPVMQVQTLAEYIFHTLELDSAAILYPNEPYGETFMNLFWDAALKAGGQITGVRSYNGNLTDFSDSIQKLTGEYFQLPDHLSVQTKTDQEDTDPLMENTTDKTLTGNFRNNRGKALDFQVIFIPDGVSRLSLLLPQLAFNDITTPIILGTNLWHDPALLHEISRYPGHAVISDGYFGQSSRPGIKKFHKTFHQLFQSNPGFLEAVAYDTVQIFFEASQNSKADSRNDLRNILASRKLFQGITGTTWFDEQGMAQKTLSLLTVKRGEFVEISQNPLTRTLNRPDPTDMTNKKAE